MGGTFGDVNAGGGGEEAFSASSFSTVGELHAPGPMRRRAETRERRRRAQPQLLGESWPCVAPISALTVTASAGSCGSHTLVRTPWCARPPGGETVVPAPIYRMILYRTVPFPYDVGATVTSAVTVLVSMSLKVTVPYSSSAGPQRALRDASPALSVWGLGPGISFAIFFAKVTPRAARRNFAKDRGPG